MVRCRGIRSRCIGLNLRVDGNSLVRYISNISIVVVSSVLNVLGSTIRKSNRVRSDNSTTAISRFSSLESSLGVVIRNSIGVGVGLRGLLLLVIGGRGVIRSRGMIRGRGSMDNRGSMVGSSVEDRGGMVDGSSMVRSGMVDNRGGMVGSSMLDGGSMIRSSMVDGGSMIRSSMVDRGSMVGSRGISSTMRNSSRCMYSCSILLSIMISINSLRSSMRLANYRCYTSIVRLKHRGGDRRSISKLDGLMVRLITSC